MGLIEVSYRRTMQVREFESITLEAKISCDSFHEAASKLESELDAELERHCKELKAKYQRLDGEELIDEA